MKTSTNKTTGATSKTSKSTTKSSQVENKSTGRGSARSNSSRVHNPEGHNQYTKK